MHKQVSEGTNAMEGADKALSVCGVRKESRGGVISLSLVYCGCQVLGQLLGIQGEGTFASIL